jgi:hypothetical protein
MNFIANSLFSVGACLIIIGSMDIGKKEKPPVIKYVPVVQSFNDSQIGLSMTSLTEVYEDMFNRKKYDIDNIGTPGKQRLQIETHNLRGKFT